VHLTLGILRKSQAVFYALSFFWLDSFAVPAPAQVTQAVGWQRQRAKPNTSLMRNVGFMFGSKIQNHFREILFMKMKKQITKLSHEDVVRSYPISTNIQGWYFRKREISMNYWCVEGIDLFGREVSRTGSELELDNLLEQCKKDAEEISSRL
jgi:hypothetical protein